jgi:predicted nucleic acid-binding protein
MSEVPTYVLDASVAFKWLVQLEDESHLEQAQNAAEDYLAGRVNLVAPAVLDYEVGHSLRSAVRRGRITELQGRRVFARYRGWDIPVVDQHDHLSQVWTLAGQLDVGFYDASYCWLAMAQGLPLLHADQRLTPKIEAVTYVPSRWIADYQSGPR